MITSEDVRDGMRRRRAVTPRGSPHSGKSLTERRVAVLMIYGLTALSASPLVRRLVRELLLSHSFLKALTN
jgi:hypothetical protein